MNILFVYLVTRLFYYYYRCIVLKILWRPPPAPHPSHPVPAPLPPPSPPPAADAVASAAAADLNRVVLPVPIGGIVDASAAISPPPQSPSSVGRPTSHVVSPASLSLPPPRPHRCRHRRRWRTRRGCRYPPPPSPSPRAGNLPVLALAGILTLAACAGDLPGVTLAACAGDLPAVAFTTPGQRERDAIRPSSHSPRTPAQSRPRHARWRFACRASWRFACRASWRFASRRRRRAWPSRARQFTPRRPRRACQLLAQECRHRRARQRFARLTLPSPCMLATCPPSPSPRVAIASAMIHMPSPSPRATATRPTSPSPRAGDSPVVAFAVAPATAPRTQDYPLPRGEVNKKYIHMPQGYF